MSRLASASAVVLAVALALVAWASSGESAQAPPTKSLPAFGKSVAVPGYAVYHRGDKKIVFAIDWTGKTPPTKVQAWYGADNSGSPLHHTKHYVRNDNLVIHMRTHTGKAGDKYPDLHGRTGIIAVQTDTTPDTYTVPVVPVDDNDPAPCDD